MKTSGIGGQAVIEGIMMRNKDKYAIAVRKPDKEIELLVKENKLLTDKYKWLNLPIIRGVVNFVESLVTGVSTISYSASFYDDPEEQQDTAVDKVGDAVFKDKLESVLMAVTVILAVVLAVGLFMVLPYFASRLLSKYVASEVVLNLVEGIVRLVVFFLYVVLISQMKDIKRTFMYHGAEHKCINCIEKGMRLTVNNVKKSSRYHKRCGTSFMFLVIIISAVLFIFIRVDNTALQLVFRVLLVPVIAGVSYEIIKLAGRTDNKVMNVISTPGMWFQKLTTKEPEVDMIEVAIEAVKAVFDVDAFLDSYYEDADDIQAELDKAEAQIALSSSLDEEHESDEEALEGEEYEDDIDADEDVGEDSNDSEEDFNEDGEDSEEDYMEQDTDIEEEQEDELSEDVFVFIEEEEQDSYAQELPVFKQRRTE